MQNETWPDQAGFLEARRRMVDSQVRPNRVDDPRILEAMRILPRERFIPPRLAASAYADADIILGNGRVLMQPMAIARLLQSARVRVGERVLVIAAGTGYGAAILAACGAEVLALEEDPALLALARRVLPELAGTFRLIDGRLAEGAADGAPWDVVIIEGAVRAIPPMIAEQVRREGGRLFTIIAEPNAVPCAVIAEPSSHGLRARPLFDCPTALLPSLEPRTAFAF